MIDSERASARAWRLAALAHFPVCLALAAVACGPGANGGGGGGGAGSGGAPGIGGGGAGGDQTGRGGGGAGGGERAVAEAALAEATRAAVARTRVAGRGGSVKRPARAAAVDRRERRPASPDKPGARRVAAGNRAAAGKRGWRGGQSGTGGQSGSGGQAGGAGAGGGGRGGATGGTGGGGTAGGSGSVGSTGCGKTSTLTFTTVPGESGQNVGTGEGGYVTIQSGGGTRGFALRLPASYDKNKPYRLIFGFHWNGGTSKDVDTGGSNGYVMAHFGLQKLSNNGAIFVAPQGLGNGWGNSGGQDLKFVDDMVKLIEDNYCVDTTHVLTNGFSYGGGMSYEIACARAKVFRAAAIYEGAQLSGCDGGNDPIALWQMVGLEDTVCPIDLATPIRDRFVKNNGCTAQNPPQPPKPPPYLSPGGISARTTPDARAGIPSVGACISRATATRSSTGRGTSTTRARRRPRPAPPPAPVAGSRRTCGRSSRPCRRRHLPARAGGTPVNQKTPSGRRAGARRGNGRPLGECVCA